MRVKEKEKKMMKVLALSVLSETIPNVKARIGNEKPMIILFFELLFLVHEEMESTTPEMVDLYSIALTVAN